MARGSEICSGSGSSDAVMKRFVLAILIFALSAGVTADEGMWTFDNIPRAEIAKRYGVQLSDHLRSCGGIRRVGGV